ncbi:hypothetical protein [Paenibacillus sacheonensis]|uniref:Uncharacterized protein n=1 Tax=Paenibacillus sacheonensis TaxID=742054 RepID=A0A7X4YV14_9BACL|nr:hypothetical protein [Paenibacillus sacheonensis]MBM7569139.1 hypothetical protein [Paenibacillus sacheonensis]NBC72973.1 hypothetical protein [Paenibacillus sacheonensis]
MAACQVNEWLDEYNDYMLLFHMFGDRTYLDEAEEIMKSMEIYVGRMLRIEKLNLASVPVIWS